MRYWAGFHHAGPVLEAGRALWRTCATAGRNSVLSAICQEAICTPPEAVKTYSDPVCIALHCVSTVLGAGMEATLSVPLAPKSVGSSHWALARSCSLAIRAAMTHMSITLRNSPKEASFVESSL